MFRYLGYITSVKDGLRDVEVRLKINAKKAARLLDTNITYKSSNDQYECEVPLLGLSGYGKSEEDAVNNALSGAENELFIKPSLVDDILKGKVK